MPKHHRFETIFSWAGILTWLAVSATSVIRAQSLQRVLIWACASALFAVAFLLVQKASQRRGQRVQWLVAVQSIAIVAMVAILCNGYEGFLLALVAAQLGWSQRGRIAYGWIAVQTLAMGAAIAYEWTLRSALLLTPPYLAFQVLMFAVTRLLAQEYAMRAELEASQRRMIELQQQVAQQLRLDERLRMTQDLHDVFGHRLTALSLNLEAAAHAKDDAAGGLATAKSLVRLLLDDVKALVDAYKDEVPVDLSAELRGLARDLPTPHVELQCPDELRFSDPRISRALLRCAQEFVTNAIRHSTATKVWIRIDSLKDEVRLLARDNGAGGQYVGDGFGLAGMRRRVQELGGILQAGVGSAGHFEVSAVLPLRERVT